MGVLAPDAMVFVVAGTFPIGPDVRYHVVLEMSADDASTFLKAPLAVTFQRLILPRLNLPVVRDNLEALGLTGRRPTEGLRILGHPVHFFRARSRARVSPRPTTPPEAA